MKLFYFSNSKKSNLNFWGAIFVLLYLSFCSHNKAEDEETEFIPPSFTRDDIFTVINYAKRNYIDPDRINQNLAYVKAAQSSLQSLPYPLFLFSKEFYQNREKLSKGDPVMPGNVLYINEKDDKNSKSSYLIFVPDYDKWDQITEKKKNELKNRYKKLKDQDRNRIYLEERKKEEEQRDFNVNAWKKTNFGLNEFKKILDWIEKNAEKYKDTPIVFKKNKKDKIPPFTLSQIYFGAINGFLSSMDPHSSLIANTGWKKMLSEAEDSSFEGIGALLRGGGTMDIIVESPLPGSPALNAGVHSGDIIHKVDGKPVDNMQLNDVVKKIRGKRGTTVILNVERPTELRFLDIKIKRDVIKQLAVSTELLSNESHGNVLMQGLKVGVIHIRSFLYAQNKTHKLVVEAYKELLEKSNMKLDALVIDLRNNPGGYLEEAVNVGELFLSDGKVVVTVKGKGEVKNLKTSKSTPLLKDMPIVTLINSGSASASEILASALMDHNTSLVVGERSFGKATVQSVEPSVSGSLIKITTARYYAPNGYTIQATGVVPDIVISDEADNSFPPRFREEDMWEHLPKLEKVTTPIKRQNWIKKLNEEVKKNGTSGLFIKEHKKDAIKTDYMLIRSIPYIQAMRRLSIKP